MRTITIQVSDSDYADVSAHFAKPNPLGRPMVSVIAMLPDHLDDDENVKAMRATARELGVTQLLSRALALLGGTEVNE